MKTILAMLGVPTGLLCDASDCYRHAVTTCEGCGEGLCGEHAVPVLGEGGCPEEDEPGALCAECAEEEP